MTKFRLIALAVLIVIVIVIVGGYLFMRTSGGMRQFDPQELVMKRDRLVKHNAQFLGRDRVAARYWIDLTGQRGYTCFAYYRIPVANGKLPVMLLLYSNPEQIDVRAQLEQVARVNEIAVLALNVDSCFGAVTQEAFSAYGAAELCLDYLGQHFAVDPNRVFVGGMGSGNGIAVPVAVVDSGRIEGIALHAPFVEHKSDVLAAARWGKGEFRDQILLVGAGNVNSVKAQSSQSAAWVPDGGIRGAKSNSLADLLTESVDWILGPEVDSTATTARAIPTEEEIRKHSATLKK